MLRNKIFQLRISEELLKAIQSKTKNVSSYIRNLVRKDLELKAEDGKEPFLEIRAKTPYTYFATLDKVSNANTLHLVIDLGFGLSGKFKVRLAGIVSPPLNTKQGQAAKDYIARQLEHCKLVVETRKKGKLESHLAIIYYHPYHSKFEDIIREGKIINHELVVKGFAKQV